MRLRSWDAGEAGGSAEMDSAGLGVAGASKCTEEGASLKFVSQSNPHSSGLTIRFVSLVVSFISQIFIHFAYRPECICTVYQSLGRDEKGDTSSPGRCRGGSKLRDDETDTADDVVGWRFV
jgi:hypothetical protein